MFPYRAVWWQLAIAFTFLLTLAVNHSDLGSVAASLAVAAAAAVLVGCGPAVWLSAVTRLAASLPAVADRSHRTVFVPQCDPDAAGRPRPRAPGWRAHR